MSNLRMVLLSQPRYIPFNTLSVMQFSIDLAEDILVHRWPTALQTRRAYYKQYERVEFCFYCHLLALDNSLLRPYLDWLHYVLDQKSIPLAISTSYDDDEQTGKNIHSSLLTSSHEPHSDSSVRLCKEGLCSVCPAR